MSNRVTNNGIMIAIINNTKKKRISLSIIGVLECFVVHSFYKMSMETQFTHRKIEIT